MKKIYIILLGLVTVLSFSSCKKFLTKEPINKFSAETFFGSEKELELYANGYINSYLPGCDDGDAIAGGDAYNDLIATKTSSDYYHPDLWSADKQSGWTWTWARRINYNIEGMEKNAKGKVDEAVYNHYMGVARFWRGYYHFNRMKTFSNIVYLDKYLEPTDSILFSARQDREEVFDKIFADLKFACENVSADSKFHTDSRNALDKYVVLTLTSRVCLYEGTFRKYHKVNPATNTAWKNPDSYKTILQYAADCAEQVMKSGAFSLHSNYNELFALNGGKLFADEVIWGRTYDGASGIRHNYTRYFNSSTLGQLYSGTKELLRMFLNADGTPIKTDQVSYNEEFLGRDPRLSYNVLSPTFNVQHLDSYMKPMQPNFSTNETGYMLVKWVYPDESHFQNAIDEYSYPYLRYAEVLLNYAEAKAELNNGELSDTDWNATIGKLRERAGVENHKPEGIYKDAWLRQYYTENLLYPDEDLFTYTDVLLEIRRERAVELCFECGLRGDDLYRWHLAELIERRHNGKGWAGVWVSKEDVEKGFYYIWVNDEIQKKYNLSSNYVISKAEYDAKLKELKDNKATDDQIKEFQALVRGEKMYSISTNVKKVSETDYPITNENDLCWSLEETKDNPGYYLIYNYKLKWDNNKMYVRPIPTTDITLNKNLGQNYGW